MSTETPIKCASAEYTAKPFHLIQANETDRRYVISFQDVDKIKTFMFAFINQASGTVAVKLRDNDDVLFRAEEVQHRADILNDLAGTPGDGQTNSQ